MLVIPLILNRYLGEGLTGWWCNFFTLRKIMLHSQLYQFQQKSDILYLQITILTGKWTNVLIYMCVSGGKKCKFFGNFCVRTK